MLGKFKVVLSWLLVFSLISFAYLPSSTSGHNEEWTCSADFGTTPKIDGQLAPRDEWSDANHISFGVVGGPQVAVYMKAIPGDYPGGGRLYLYYAVPNLFYEISFEWCSLHNLGSKPQTDDRRIAADVAGGEFPSFFTFATGTGTGWQTVSQPPGFSGAISPAGQEYWIVEMAIPYDFLGIEICDPSPKGCLFDAVAMEPDGKPAFYYWPPASATKADWVVPNTWGNMVPSDCWGAPRGRLLIFESENSPPDHNYDPGDKFNEMMELVLTADEEQSQDVVPENVYLNDLTITATGTGNDQTDIANVLLIEDTNHDALYDGTEPVLASGTYPSDNGSITFTFPAPGLLIKLGEPKYLLVVYLMNPSPPVGATYQFFVSGINATGAVSGSPVPVLGYREQLPATVAVLWRYILFSALKTVPGPTGKPVLTIQKKATADTVMAGENITFFILVANKGDQTLYYVKVTDSLPDHTSFVDAPATLWGPAGTFDSATKITTWDLGNLAPGEWRLLKLIVKVDPATPDGTLIRNKAVATSTRPPLTVESEDEVVIVGGKIHEAYIKGYTGDLGNIFGPMRNVTRAEIAAIIARLLHLESTVTGEQFYADVPPSHWSFKYVEAVHRAGIMKGFPDGTFRPDEPATRANVAVAMIRARDIDPVVFLPAPPFPDISGHWAIKEIETAYVLGIVEGLPDGTFHPDDPIIRAETVTLIDRALGRGPLLEGPVVQHFPDCHPTDWFYGWGEESFASHKGVHMATGNEKLIEYVDTGPVW
ncbi:MAG: S-layer homology domain-containing protein [bacterium]